MGSWSPTRSAGVRTGGRCTTPTRRRESFPRGTSIPSPATSPIGGHSCASLTARAIPTAPPWTPTASSGSPTGMAGALHATIPPVAWRASSICRCSARPARPSAAQTSTCSTSPPRRSISRPRSARASHGPVECWRSIRAFAESPSAASRAERLQETRRANIERGLDESSRPQEYVGFIVMFRFGYGATGNASRGTAEPNALEQVALRGAESSVLWWWSLLLIVSAANLALWVVIAFGVQGLSDGYAAQQLLLSGIFAVACAFRSILPRVDLERQCLWNSPLSSIFVGRSVATVAELAFAGQCALLIAKLSALTANAWLEVVGWSLLPLIVLAQLCCWHAVISLNHLGHAIEEILWSVLAFLVALSLGLTFGQMPAGGRILSGFGMVACAGAAYLMLAVDVPMYLARWRQGRKCGVRYLSITEGLRDALQRRQVAR